VEQFSCYALSLEHSWDYTTFNIIHNWSA
jgi:hypothetical protein